MPFFSRFKFSSKILKGKIVKRGGVCIVVASLISASYLKIKEQLKSYSVESKASSIAHDKEECAYIYATSNVKGLHMDELNAAHDDSFTAPFESKENPLYLVLLDLAKSKDPKFRFRAVKELTEISNLNDSQYNTIAQASDLRTAVGMSRTYNSTTKLFLPPPSRKLLLSGNKTVVNLFQEIFEDLPLGGDDNQCADYLTMTAKRYLHLCYTNVGLNVLDSFVTADESVYDVSKKRITSVADTKKCLDALLAHSVIPSHRDLMVKKGVLPLLHQVQEIYSNNNEIKSLIGQIIGNIALDTDQHNAIFASGWIRILAEWIKSPYIEINLPACRALANMDKDYLNDTQFEDGIFLLHPQFRNDQNQEVIADVVFVHGLMGGAFKTWRQHDGKKIPHTENNTESESMGNETNFVFPEYTFCWPKDWLAEDLPYLRLIAVDYSSHISEWKLKCSKDKKKRDLKIRSVDVLKKLMKAGIGKRPVVWVTHSMGGIMVKQLLLEASMLEDKSVLEKTCGIVFYSVPHKGSDFANLSHGAMLLLQPSIEIRQMIKGSRFLLQLHDNFKKLLEAQGIPVLSFGETIESHLGWSWKSLLVPSDSANPGFGEFHELLTTHLDTCKPETKDSPSYFLLLKFLSSLPLQSSSSSSDRSSREWELGLCIILGLCN